VTVLLVSCYGIVCGSCSLLPDMILFSIALNAGQTMNGCGVELIFNCPVTELVGIFKRKSASIQSVNESAM